MSDAPLSRTGQSMQRPRFLLVDDEPSVLRGLKRILETHQPFWLIDVAKDGQTALELMQRNGYDVLITDLHMPSMNGASLLLRASHTHPKIVRIVHSSRCETLEASSFARLVHRVLPKPATAMDIIKAATWAISRSRGTASDSRCA